MNASARSVCILGATGSIGSSALDVIARHPERFQVHALSADTRVDDLIDLCRRFLPARAVIAQADLLPRLHAGLKEHGLSTEPLAGPQALCTIAADREIDTVVAAIVGAAGMPSTLAAAHAGKRILLANKESVVLAGELLLHAARAHDARIIPIDSEHNAIFQCLPAGSSVPVDGLRGVRRLVLTASGGPFRGRSRGELANVTPAQACAHPNWSMGRKISVDSATLMNKGLEVIEAHWLFALPPERIDVLVHPQSIVHSLVEYVDGSTLAQLGNPDMRTALAHALAWPERVESGVPALDLARIAQLEFSEPDRVTFPCLDLAYQALRSGGCASAILNAANEVAVSAFLQARLRFLDIPTLIAATLDRVAAVAADSIDTLLAADREARASALHVLRALEI